MEFGNFAGFWAGLYWAAYILTGIASAYFIYQDAIKQAKLALNISPYWWAFFALFGSFYTIAIYWLMQHSGLSRHND